tara:strand:- start:366 stop:575 length:210 start_codon:yes stop_codon:yes gene_type:complete
LLGQRRQIQQAVFKPGYDLGIHAAVMLPGNFGDMFPHTLRQANDEFVSSTTGVMLGSSFHMGNINRLRE